MINHKIKLPAKLLGSVARRYRLPWSESIKTDWLTISSAPTLPEKSRMISRAKNSNRHLRDEKMARLEAVLFLSREPLNSRKLSQFANLADATEARTLVRRLNELYDRSARAFRVEEVALGYQLFTRPQFGRWLRRLQQIPGEVRLSAPALETLAVVAYRQPAARADIDAIRGVNCGEILRQLLERDLIRIAGRSEELGRPYLYTTTKRFLQLFGLRNLEDLPRTIVFGGLATDGLKTSNDRLHDSGDKILQEESDVCLTIATNMLTWEDDPMNSASCLPRPQLAKADDDDMDVDVDEEELDDDDDLEDDDLEDDDDLEEEEDDDDEEFIDDEDDAEEEEEEDDLEEEEWEEVGDSDEEEDEEDDDDDDDWEDDDDDDWEEDEEEEEEAV